MTEWQPIETAPKDGFSPRSPGPTILLYRPGKEVRTGFYNPKSYLKTPSPFWEDTNPYMGVTWMRNNPPTHWMPLPIPPGEIK